MADWRDRGYGFRYAVPKRTTRTRHQCCRSSNNSIKPTLTHKRLLVLFLLACFLQSRRPFNMSTIADRSTISGRNRSSAMFYENHHRRSSPLAHPHGLQVLQYYAQTMKYSDKKEPILAFKLEDSILKSETDITSDLRDALKPCVKGMRLTISGEQEEFMQGTIDGVEVAGRPDIVIRETKQERAVMIMEVSVDGNGGEKKIGQAFEYANLIDRESVDNEPIILFTIHIRRSKTLKITQEAFLYVHDNQESQRKVGFLWREYYEAAEGESDFDFLARSCAGIVRSIRCAQYMSEIESSPTNSTWEAVSDNVAINEEFVFKIFDNRFHPTDRKTDVWLGNFAWLAELGVEVVFYYREGESVNCSIGKPTTTKYWTRRVSVPYGKGSVCVIRYRRANGTHIASKVSHFRDIARCISEMHHAGIVHGDIRGFNMLHPHPHAVETRGAISTSCLIDFDFSGNDGSDKYPPGYAASVEENAFLRIGKPKRIMKKDDDWYELGSVMMVCQMTLRQANSFDEHERLQTAWEEMCTQSGQQEQKRIGGNASLAIEIDKFIGKYGDVTIALPDDRQDRWGEQLFKGTGSPQKMLQGPRGPGTIVNAPTVAQDMSSSEESVVASQPQLFCDPELSRAIPASRGNASSRGKHVITSADAGGLVHRAQKKAQKRAADTSYTSSDEDESVGAAGNGVSPQNMKGLKKKN